MVHPKQNDLINKTKDQLIPLIRSKKQNEMKASYQNKLETVLNQIQDCFKLVGLASSLARAENRAGFGTSRGG